MVQNTPSYARKHLYGHASGINLIYVGDQKFTGFGLPPEGCSLREVTLWFIREHNAPPVTSELIDPHGYSRLKSKLSSAGLEKLGLRPLFASSEGYVSLTRLMELKELGKLDAEEHLAIIEAVREQSLRFEATACSWPDVSENEGVREISVLNPRNHIIISLKAIEYLFNLRQPE